ncbi:MAG: hypothetical protein ABFC63_09850 [Thermoguttaceae bacterium]
MSARRRHSLVFRSLVLTLTLVAIGWHCPRQAVADSFDKLDTSLKLIPGDAAFYASVLRNRECFEAIRQSSAVAKILEMPIVQTGIMFYNIQLATPESNVAKFDAFLKNPESRKLLNMAADMASDEVFLYGDKSFADFVKLFQAVNAARTYAPLMALAGGHATQMSPNQMQAKAMMASLAKNASLINVPDLVLGFKVKDIDLAKEQLIKLEMIVNLTLQGAGVDEKIINRFKKTKVGDYDFLVADLDGSLIPWDAVPLERFKELEAQPGDAQKIIDRIKKCKLVVAIGLRGNYLLCSIGSSLDCLHKLGQSQRLLDRAEFKPLGKYVDKRLVYVGYMSEAIGRQLNNQKKQLDDLLEAVDQLLPSSKLDDKQKDRIRKDVKSLTADLKTLAPDAGAVMGFSFITDRGIEGYRYVWGGHGSLDGSKPLGLLEYVGGNPLMGLVARQKIDVKSYDLLVKWAKTGYGYFRDFAMPAMKPDERKKAEKFIAAALPTIERLDKVNREMLLPALADGQSAVLIDQKLSTKKLFAAMPAAEKAMPIVEPAIVVGLSDAGLFKKALSEYRTGVNQLIDAVRNIEGSDVPANVRIPDPEVTKNSQGTIYSFKLPEDWSVDKQIIPNVAVSDKVALFTISRAHTDRLLAKKPLSVGGVLAKPERPLATAGWLNWAGVMDAAAPWIDLAISEKMEERGVEDVQQAATLTQVHMAIDVLKVLRSITSENYLEDKAMVQHTLVELKDVEK